jgi:adenylate cyclase class 2
MGLEIECKIYLPSLTKIQAILEGAGAEISHPRVYEHNIRYESPANDLTARHMVLRLRQDHDVRLTFKAPAEQLSAGNITRLELETTVGDFATMDSILQHLGYQHSMVYEKYRTTYRLPDMPEIEIVLDEMPYGLFLEVEGTPEGIEIALQKLSLANEPRILKGYVDLFELIRVKYQLTFRDLTFQNFANLSITPEIFTPSPQS